MERLPLVDPGPYEVVCLACRKTKKFNRDVLVFSFKIVSQGPGFDTVLPTYINYPIGKGRAVPPKSKLGEWLRIIQSFDPTLNLRRVSLSLFSKFQFMATVETVTKNHDGELLPEYRHSSKVANLTGVVGRFG